MLQEFRDFAVRGNVLDMAVGIIIGAAFTSIVRSAVDDVIMPPIGLILGGVDFSDLFINLSNQPADSLTAAKDAGIAVIAYGKFINAVISFAIVAFILFWVVRAMNILKRREEAAPPPPAEPPREQVLLEEIRDLLKAKS